MRGERKYSALTIITMIMAVIVIGEFIIIFRSVFIIKKENVYLKNQVISLVGVNKELEAKYKEISEKLEVILEPKNNPPGVPFEWKSYRYFEYGFQFAYPGELKIKTNIVNQDGSKGLKIYSQDQSVFVDIKMVDCSPFKDIKDYILSAYEYKVYPKSKVVINNQEYELHKLQGNKQYYLFMKNNNYIIEANSPSEELLINVVKTIKFI